MARYQINTPQGSYEINGPDDMSEQQAYGYLQKQLGQQQQPKPGVLADVGQAAVTGPLRGLGKFLVAPGEAEATAMGATGFPMEGVPTQADVDRRIPSAQTLPGRIVQNVGEVAGNPASWFGPGSFLTKAASNVLSGIGGEVGQEVAGPAGGLIGGGLGSIAGESSLSRLSARAPAAPTEAAIRDASNAGYAQARSMDVPLNRSVVQDLGRSIRSDLTSPQYGHRPFNEPKTFAALRLLEEPNTMTGAQLRRRMGTTGPSSSTEILGVRQTLENIRRENPGTSDALAASRAISRIDTYLNNVPGLNETLRGARGDWRAAAHASELNSAIDRATRTAQQRGGNTANNMRAELNRLIDDKSIPRTPAEEAELRRIVGSGGIAQELARFRREGVLGAVAGASAAAATGHLLPAAGIVGGALLSGLPRTFDAWRTRRNIEALRDDILRAAPSGGGPAPPLPPAVSASQIPPAVLRGLLGGSNLDDLATRSR